MIRSLARDVFGYIEDDLGAIAMQIQNLNWVRIILGGLAGFVVWIVWQTCITSSPEAESVKFRYFLSESILGPNSAARALQAGLGTDYTKSQNILLFLPIGAIAGIAFSALGPRPRFLLWMCITLLLTLAAVYTFEVRHLVIPFGGPLAMINALYICGTLIHLESEKIERSRSLAIDLQIQAEEERKRIAQDLHDEALPSLNRVMRLADQMHEEHGETSLPQDIRRNLEEVVQEMRRVINDLHPAILENLGLAPSLEHLSNKLSLDTSIQTSFRDHTNGIRLSPFHELSIYRIAQEAVNNVEKHSNATQMEIILERIDSNLQISICDNGGGELVRKPDSFGLRNMEHRARLIGASLSWQKPSQFPSGTMVLLTVATNSIESTPPSGKQTISSDIES